MKKVYFLLEPSRAIFGYSDSPIPNTVEIEIEENSELLDPEVFNHYFLTEEKEFVKMTDEEFNKLRPYYNKPMLNNEQILESQVKTLQSENEELENCIVEMANVIYQ